MNVVSDKPLHQHTHTRVRRNHLLSNTLCWELHNYLLPFSLIIGTESNFEITNPSFVTTQSIRYDIGSIMHYSARAFSSNGNPTIVPVDPNVPLSDLGQRQRLSALDLQHVTTLYCRGKSIGCCVIINRSLSVLGGLGRGAQEKLLRFLPPKMT